MIHPNNRPSIQAQVVGFREKNILLMPLGEIIGIEPGTEQYEIGDVNGDGSITVIDALLCSNYILGLFELQPQEFLAADADGNNIINILDVLLVSDLSGQDI